MLSEEYFERLTEDEFVRAVDLLSDEVKASVFITLPVRDIRDRWLEKHASIVLI